MQRSVPTLSSSSLVFFLFCMVSGVAGDRPKDSSGNVLPPSAEANIAALESLIQGVQKAQVVSDGGAEVAKQEAHAVEAAHEAEKVEAKAEQTQMAATKHTQHKSKQHSKKKSEEKQHHDTGSLKEVRAHAHKAAAPTTSTDLPGPLNKAVSLHEKKKEETHKAVASTHNSSSLGYSGLHKTGEKLEEMSRAWDQHVRGAFTETAKTALNVSEKYHEALKHLEENLDNFDKGAKEFQHKTYEVHDAKVAELQDSLKKGVERPH